MRVSLTDEKQKGDDCAHARVRMRIEGNSGSTAGWSDAAAPQTLSERMILGFARQLRGTLDITNDAGRHAVTVEFLALPFSSEADPPPVDASNGRA